MSFPNKLLRAKLMAKAKDASKKKKSLALTSHEDLKILDMGVKLREDLLKAVDNRDVQGLEKNFLMYKVAISEADGNEHGINATQNIFTHALLRAAELGYQEVIEHFIAAGFDINRKNYEGDTALMVAARTGNIKLTLFLLSKNADPNIQNIDGCIALDVAVTLGHTAIVQCLLGKKSIVNSQNDEGITPLMRAAARNDIIIVKALLKAGADLSLEDEKRWTAPIHALIGHQFEVLKHFLETPGFNIENANSEDYTLLMVAVSNNDFLAFDFLIKAGANYLDLRVLSRVVQCTNNNILNYLLETKKINTETICDDLGNTLLHCAATFGNIEVLKILLSQEKIDLEKKNGKGATPLMIAAKCGYVSCVDLLLNKGADVNAKSLDYKTALMAAVEDGHTEVVQRLLACRSPENRIAVDQMDNDDPSYNALLIAVLHGRKEIVELLLAAGADPSVLYGTDTLIIRAAIKGHAEILEILLKTQKHTIDVKNIYGATALLYAAHGYTECVRVLLEHGANPNIANDDGFTPLTIAVFHDHPEIVKLLISAKANLNARNLDGSTALIYASYQNHEHCLGLLLEAGATDSLDKNGESALSLAMKSKHYNIIKRLLTPERVKEIITHQQEAEISMNATDASTVIILQKLGIQVNTLTCQMQVAVRAYGMYPAEDIEEYLEVVDVNQPLQVVVEGDFCAGNKISDIPIFMLSNACDARTRSLILKHKLYKSSTHGRHKIDSFVDNLDKIATLVKFSREGSLCITLESSGKPYRITLSQRGVESILTRTKMTPFKQILWESSEEAQELKDAQEIRDLKDTAFSTLLRMSNQIQRDQNLIDQIPQSLQRHQTTGVTLEAQALLSETCKSHHSQYHKIRQEIINKIIDMFDAREICNFIEILKTLSASYQMQVTEPLNLMQQKISLSLSKSFETRRKISRKVNKNGRKARNIRTEDEDKRRDEQANMVPKEFLFSESPEKSKGTENPKISEKPKMPETPKVSKKQDASKELQSSKASPDSSPKASPKASPSTSPKLSPAATMGPKTIDVPKIPNILIDDQAIERQRKQVLSQGIRVRPKADPMVLPKELPLSVQGMAQKCIGALRGRETDLRRYMKIPDFTFEGASQINSRLKAQNGREILKITANALSGNTSGIDSLIETNAALGALAQTLETRKGLNEEWPNQVRDVIFRFEEMIRKNYSEEVLINLIREISRKFEAITESDLMKRKGKLPLADVDSDNFLKTLSAQAVNIPIFSESRAQMFIQQSERELEHFRTTLAKISAEVLSNTKFMHKLKMAIGFSLARIGTHLSDIKKNQGKVQSSYGKYIPLGKQYRHTDPDWNRSVETFIEECLNSSPLYDGILENYAILAEAGIKMEHFLPQEYRQTLEFIMQKGGSRPEPLLFSQRGSRPASSVMHPRNPALIMPPMNSPVTPSLQQILDQSMSPGEGGAPLIFSQKTGANPSAPIPGIVPSTIQSGPLQAMNPPLNIQAQETSQVGASWAAA